MADPRVCLRTPAGKPYWLLYGVIRKSDNRMVYIGQSMMLFPIRWGLHLSKLGHATSGRCHLLSETLLQEGPGNFEPVELAATFSKRDANSVEALLIKQWETLAPDGANDAQSARHRAATSVWAKAFMRTPEMQAKKAAIMRQRWSDPAKAAKMLAALEAHRDSPKRLAPLAEVLRKRNKTPEHRARTVARNKSPGHSARIKRAWEEGRMWTRKRQAIDPPE